MEIYTVIGIAVGLSMDAFAVSIATSVALPSLTARHYFRLSFHFGFFQFAMPLVGWLAGTGFARYVEAYDHWVAFGLLAFIGVRMIGGAIRECGSSKDGGRRSANGKDPTRGASLVMLSVATSIDAFAVGISFAMLKSGVLLPCVLIGIITAGLTWTGMRLGARLGRHFGAWMEIAGGVVLLAIGTRIVLQHSALA